MDKAKTTKRIHVSTYTVKAANNKVLSSKNASNALSRAPATGKFVSRDELKTAFKNAAQKLKSA